VLNDSNMYPSLSGLRGTNNHWRNVVSNVKVTLHSSNRQRFSSMVLFWFSPKTLSLHNELAHVLTWGCKTRNTECCVTQVLRDPYSLKNRISSTFGIHFVLASTSLLGRFEQTEYCKSFLNKTAIFFRGGVFLIKVVGHSYVYKVCKLFQRNDIVFICVVLGQTKMAPAKMELVSIANSTSSQKN
jgi:hypothetical protein